MIIGVPKEIKPQEGRVALTPEGTSRIVEQGHRVLVEKSAGYGSGSSDREYRRAGARIVSQEAAWSADLIIKVKEPIQEEFQFFRNGQILFTFLHLAPNKRLTRRLKNSGVTAIAYETVQLKDGSTPLLRPMSEISGKLAIQEAAYLLKGERGLLFGGTSGVSPAHVLILGGGNVGVNAAETALGMDARVTIMDSKREKIVALDERLRKLLKLSNIASGARYQQIRCALQNENELRRLVSSVDVLIGAPYVKGRKAPVLVRKDMVETMKKGSIIIDVSIDQGGCVETSRATKHDNPIFTKYGVVHYCVTNMPGVVPRTSTLALTKETLPYILELANKGFVQAVRNNPALARGVNVYKGKITHEGLAKNMSEEYTPIEELLR